VTGVFFERLLSARWTVLRGLVLIACLIFGFHQKSGVYQLDISIGLKIPPKAVAQVFYAFKGQVFPSENNQVMLPYQGPSGEITYEARLRSSKPIRLVRLDLSNKAGDVFWSSVTLKGLSGARHYQGRDLPIMAQSYDQLAVVSTDDTGQHLVATTIDPKVFVVIPPELTALPADVVWRHWLSIVSWSFLIVGAFEWLLRVLRRKHPLNVKVTALLEGVAARWSEDATIRFRPASLMVYVVLLFLASGWVALKLNQSSVAMWDQRFPAEFVEREFMLGTPRDIRTDEWNTMTPWMLSQVQSGMKADNPNLGAPASAMLAGAPRLNPLMLAQPKYWGFVFLDLERGFSWLWAFKSFGLVAAFFTLLLLLTKSDVTVSLAGAIAIYGSSYVQWWLSSVPAEVISGFSAAVVGTVYLLRSRKTGGMVFGAFLVAMAVPNLLLHLYPPYLQPLAYLAVFLLIGLLANQQSFELMKTRLRLRLFLTAMALTVMAVLVVIWYRETAEAIRLVLNTDYPGHRTSAGGDYPLGRLFYGVFESWKVIDKTIPFPPVNPPEASSFWILFPLAPLLVPVKQWAKPAMRPVVWVFAFCMLTLAWTSLPLPDVVRELLGNAGWYLTPATRGEFSLAVGSSILMACLTAAVARGDVQAIRLPAPFVAMMVFAAAMLFGMYLQSKDPEFFHLQRLLLGSAVVAAIAWAILAGNRTAYLWLAVLVALPTMHVNPIQSGLGAYLNKSILRKARDLGGQKGDIWAVFGDTDLAQGFKAVGLEVLNGTHYAPRLQWLGILDPDQRYKQVWNRYAHIGLVGGQPDQPPRFIIEVADSYHIEVDVCGPEFKAIGVTHVAFTYLPKPNETRCLIPLLSADPSGVELYQLKAQ
jgi:hypothetical protein